MLLQHTEMSPVVAAFFMNNTYAGTPANTHINERMGISASIRVSEAPQNKYDTLL